MTVFHIITALLCFYGVPGIWIYTDPFHVDKLLLLFCTGTIKVTVLPNNGNTLHSDSEPHIKATLESQIHIGRPRDRLNTPTSSKI